MTHKIIYSCFLTNVGYTRAALGYIKSLLINNFDVKINCIHKYPHGNSFTKEELHMIRDRCQLINLSGDILIEHVIPNRWRKELHGSKKACVAVYENEKVDQFWIDSINKNMDYVIYPSQWNKDIFEKCGVVKNGSVVPHFLDEDIWVPSDNNRNELFTFCIIATWRERKNWNLVFDSFNKLSKNYNFILNIKTDKSKDLLKYVSQNYSNLLKFIILEDSEFNDIQMVEYMNKQDCIVSFSYGEAFCLPLLQSIFLGKPFVSTDIPGVKDFLSSDFGCFIPQNGTIKKDKMDHYPQFFNKEWPFFNSDDACRALSELIEKYDTYKNNIKINRDRFLSKFGLKSSITNKYWDHMIRLC